MTAEAKEITVQSLFDQAEAWGAAKMQMVFSDDGGEPLRAVIVVDGQPETAEILEAVEAVQARWDAEADD